MEETKVNVSICTGTTCYAQGRAILNELLKTVPEKYGKTVKVAGTPCLEVCSIDWEHNKAPYVKINDEILQEATTEKVLAAIDKCLENKE